MARDFLLCSQVTLKNNLTHFKDTSENQKKLLMNGCTYSDLMRDMIYSQAMQSNMICYFINHVATSYGQISSDHIMPQVKHTIHSKLHNPLNQTQGQL